MTLLLRKIRTNRWSAAEENRSWLKPNQIVADPMADFATLEGKLSLFKVEDDLSNLDRVITALAATRDDFANFDYILIDIQVLVKEGFQLKETKGDTPDNQVNQWHYNMVELSAESVRNLTYTFFHRKHSYSRKRKKEIEHLIRESVDLFNIEKLKKPMKEKLGL